MPVALDRAAAADLQFRLLSEHATLPVRATEQSAGLDLTAAADVDIPAHGKAMVKTDLAVVIPEGHYGRIAPRSSLAWKHHIAVGAGVIDADYRGPVGIILYNHGHVAYSIKQGERVAQLIIEKVAIMEPVQVSNLPQSTRGEGGFGSTGNLANLHTLD